MNNDNPYDYSIEDGDSADVESPLGASASAAESPAESPYYALREDDAAEEGSGLLYSSIPDDGGDSGDEEDEEDENVEDEEDGDASSGGSGRPSLAGVLIRLLTSPVEGWKALRRGRFTPEEVASSLFYPLCGAAAIADFACYFYDINVQLTDVLIEALGTFLSYFLGFYLSSLGLKILLPGRIKSFPDSAPGRIFIMAALSTMALFHIFLVALPMLEPVLFFLPLWTAYVIVRGTRFVKAPEDKRSYTAGTLCLAIIGSPILISWAFSLIR